MSNPTLTPIYSRLNGTDNYHPFTADTFADWTSEAGDTVVISRDGTDYSAPIHSQTLMWKGQHQISMESRGTKEREPIEKMSNRKYGRGGGGASAGRTARGKTFVFEANQDHLLYEIDDPENGLVRRFEITETSLQSEIVRATETESGLQVELSSFEQDLNGVRTTVGTMRSELDTIEGSALWTQRDAITGVVGEFEVKESGGVKSIVVKSGGGLKVERNNVEYGIYDNGNLTAGVIATKVNGYTSTKISGDNILIGDETATTVINGKLSADDITATYIGAVLTNSSVLSTNYAFSRTLDCDRFIQDDYDLFVPDAVCAARIIPDGANYKLQIKHFYSDNWVDAGTFNRAASQIVTLSGEWSGRYFTVTADPRAGADPWEVSCGVYEELVPSGSVRYDSSNKTVSQDFLVYNEDEQGDAGGLILRTPITISADDAYQAGYNVVKGNYTKSGGVLNITKGTSGTAFPLSFTVTSGISYNPSSHSYTANAYCDDDWMDSTNSGTEAYLAGKTDGVDSVKGNWTKSGGVLNITKGTSGTAFPLSFTVTSGISYNPSSHSYTANAYCDDDWMDSANSGTEAYEAGYTNGSPSSGATGGRSGSTYNWTFSITKGDGTTASLTIDASAIYSDARSGYTQGTFSRAALTLRGGQISNAYQAVDTGGTMYYTKGSTVYYGRGTKATTKQGGNNVGFKRHSSTEKPTGTWYSIVSSGADVSYFTQKNASFEYYPGDGPHGYFAETSSLKKFKSITAYNSGTSYDTNNSPYYTKS